MSGPEQAEALATNPIDLGFVHPPVPDGGAFGFEKVTEERFIAALPSSHRLTSRKRVPATELATEKFVFFPRELAPGCYDAIQRICGAVTLFPECVRTRRVPGVSFREIDGSVTTVTCGFQRHSGETPKQVERFLKLWRRRLH